jgi:hypothetical protein
MSVQIRHVTRRSALALLALGTLVTSGARVAHAQQVQGGPTTAVLPMFVRGVDSAADPSGNYLVVGGQGPLFALCVNSQGTPVTGRIPVSNGGYGSFPRAVYSPSAGGFMVVWAEALGDPAGNSARSILARVVNCSGAVGPAQVVAPGVFWEPGDMAIAYSSTSQVFLVAWQTFPDHRINATEINLDGARVGPVVALSSGLGRDPSVAWNPNTNEFGVAFSGETYSAFTIVPAGNPAAFRRNTFNVSGGILTTMTDVAFNPQTGMFVMAWYELSSGAFAKVAEFDNGPNLLTTGVASGRLGSYDAFAMALGSAGQTFLMVGVDRASDAILGLELNTRGFPFNGENTLSPTRPSRYPRVSASKISQSFNVAFSGPNFGALSSLIATSFAPHGGPAGVFPAPGAPAPAPPPPTSGGGAAACPGTAPVPGWLCISGNWIPPDSPLAGGAAPPPAPAPAPPPPSGAACPGFVPGMHCVNGNWVPDAPGTPAPAPAPAPAPPPPTSACPGTAPVAGWLCISGGWIPPDSSLARGATPSPAPPPPPPPVTGGTAACVGSPPVAGWLCAGTNWVPPDHPLAAGAVPASQVAYNDGTCSGTAPVAGWVCIRSGWMPRDNPMAIALLGR